tara:strand:- start:990 stop:1319 length:330 start_codon:yes stop_codon:yes gene_type:complete
MTTTTNTTTTETTGTTTTTTPATTGQLALSAVVAAFQAQRETALAQISLFINNPAGVADHNNFVEEIQSCVTQLTEATAALNTIQTTFSFGTTTPVTPANVSGNTTNQS